MSATTTAKSSSKHPSWVLGIGFGLGLLVGAGMLVGSWMTFSVQQPPFVLPETALHAMATDSGETFSICTGSIADGVEGIFCLDFLTGDLQCWVMDNRSNAVAGYFVHNVVADLGIDQGRKNPQYLMVTGLTGLRGGGGAMRPAESLLYVADANSGNIVGYAVPWNRTARVGQKGVLLPVFKQAARQVEIRGQ